MNDTEQMKILADQLFLYMKPKFEKMTRDCVRYFRAKVVSNPGNNTLEVQRALDSTTMTLPCTNAIAGASANSQVMVFVLGDLSNAVVVADGKMEEL